MWSAGLVGAVRARTHVGHAGNKCDGAESERQAVVESAFGGVGGEAVTEVRRGWYVRNNPF